MEKGDSRKRRIWIWVKTWIDWRYDQNCSKEKKSYSRAIGGIGGCKKITDFKTWKQHGKRDIRNCDANFQCSRSETEFKPSDVKVIFSNNQAFLKSVKHGYRMVCRWSYDDE